MCENPDLPRSAVELSSRARWRGGLIIFLAVLAAMLVAAPAWAAPVSLPSLRIDGAAPGDRVGASVAVAGDVNGDGSRDVIVGAPGAGAAYVLLGPFQAGTTIDLANLAGRGFVLRGSPQQAAGTSVAAAGDVNGDGLADVIVGAPGATPHQEGPQTQPGRAHIVFGSRTPHDTDLSAPGSAGITLIGGRFRFPDAFGWQVAGVGDVDRDGRADVAIAAPGNPGFEDEFTKGRAYVVFGRRTPGTITMGRLGHSGFRIGFDELTSVSAAGDWDRDGRADIAVMGNSAVRVIYGQRYHAPIDLAHLGRHGLTIRTRQPYRFENGAVTGGMDVNGDGHADVVIGEPAAHLVGFGPSNGGAWLVAGSASRETVNLGAPGRRAWEPAIGGRGWMAGSAVALGRVNADRRADVVMVANGSLAVVYGTATHRTVRLDAIPAGRGFLVDGSMEPAPSGSPPGRGGFVSSAAGDLDGNGRAELLAGAPFASHEGRPNAGSAYLFVR
jgi:hypothetical protein